MAKQELSFKLEIDWDFDTAYTDETDYLIAASGAISMQAPGSSVTSGRGITSTMTLLMDNTSNRYSPLNSTGALYSAIQSGKAYHAPVRLLIRTDGGTPTTTHAQFIGVIKLPTETGRTASQAGTVTIQCVSKEELLMQTRISTTNTQFQSVFNDGYDESDIIEQYLDAISNQNSVISDGADYVSQTTGGTTTLDRGLFQVPWAWLDDESPVDDIYQLAAACGGRFFCSPVDGKFYYHNATHVLTDSRSASSQETFDETNMKSFKATYDDRDMYNQVIVEYSGRAVGGIDVLWQPDEPILVPADTTMAYTVTLQQPAWEIDSISYTAVTAGGTNIDSDVTVTATTTYAQRITLSIVNANTTHAAQLRQMSIVGRTVSGRPTAEVGRNSTNDGTNGAWWSGRGDRTRSIRGNPYMQTRLQAISLAEFLLNRQEYPALKFSGEALGTYDRRVGDRVTFDFDGVMDSTRTGILTTIRFKLSRAGYTHTLEAIDTTELYPYIDGTYGYFVLGTNYLGTTHASRARLFF